MLIEFRVDNYRSIRDEQVLSMVASKDKSHQETHVIPTKIKSIPGVLSSAVVYGPNASGKSNLVKALGYFCAMVRDSAIAVKPGERFNVQPFRLNSENCDAPTRFEMTFILEGVRHQYGFEFTAERITGEWLLVYKSAKPQLWLSRSYSKEQGGDIFGFGSYLTGQRKQWQEVTRENALFLSTAAQWNSEQLQPIFEFITQNIVVLGTGANIPQDFSVSILEQETERKALVQFLSAADTGIKDIRLGKKKGKHQRIHVDMSSGKSEMSSQVDLDVLYPEFIHETEDGSAVFELEDESLGTQRLFAIAGPVLDILKRGRLLVIDELDSSLHTLLVRFLVNLFHDKDINVHGAQIVFTTHDTALLDADVFRRDQIWFVEKDLQQASELTPLSDFSPRKHEALERGYLDGRYGGIPFLRSLEL